jgi:malate dehydrogenase (oxaloacetate-decarboxylating)
MSVETAGKQPVEERSFQEAPDGGYVTMARGLGVLRTPLLNKGTAFTREERAELGLDGLLPPVVTTLEEQERRVYRQYRAQPTDLLKNVYLTALHDRNEHQGKPPRQDEVRRA